MRLVCAIAALILAQPALAEKPTLSVSGHGIFTFTPDPGSPGVTQTLQITISAQQSDAGTTGIVIGGELGGTVMRYPVTQIEQTDIPGGTCVTYQVSNDPAVDFWYGYALIIDGTAAQPDKVALFGGEPTRCTLALAVDPSYVLGLLTPLSAGNFVIKP